MNIQKNFRIIKIVTFMDNLPIQKIFYSIENYSNINESILFVKVKTKEAEHSI